MAELQSWAVTVCLAALAAGIAGTLTPKGNLEKTFKFTLALFFLCCVLVPAFQLKNIRLDIRDVPQLSSSAGEGIQSTVDAQKVTQAQDNVTRLVTATFQKYGATPQTVKVGISMGQDGSVSVESADVVLSRADYPRKDSLVKAVQGELGVPITATEGET